MRMKLQTLLGIAAMGWILGCDGEDSHHHHEHDHGHEAPNGGTLVVLGEEACHLELLHDAREGRLTLYAHQFHPQHVYVKLAMGQIEVNASAGGPWAMLSLKPVVNEVLGNTEGRSSEFAAGAPWLKGASNLSGTLLRVEVGGQSFTNKAFTLR